MWAAATSVFLRIPRFHRQVVGFEAVVFEKFVQRKLADVLETFIFVVTLLNGVIIKTVSNFTATPTAPEWCNLQGKMIHHRPSIFLKAVHRVFDGTHSFHSVSGHGAAGRSSVTKTGRRSYYFPTAVGLSVAIPAVWYYSLDSTSKRNVRTSVGGVRRFIKTLGIGLTISCDYSYSLWGRTEGTEEYKTAIKACHQRGADRILSGCLANGGLYIKLGQSLVALNHLLPREYLDTLEVLHDQALVRVGDEINELFYEDFGCLPEKLFAQFDRSPIAAASLAQVFKAKTHEGKNVAVKVQFIDLQQRFTGDLNGIGILLHVVSWMHPNFNFAWILDYLKSCLVKELDFEHEACNMERCARDLKHLRFVYVPKVQWPETSKRVLTMEFIDGVKISDLQGIRRLGLDLADVDRKMVAAFAEQLFHTGFVHADPHPGNVFVQKGEDGKARIVLLDHGLYEDITNENRLSLCQLWKAIIMNDQVAMKAHSLELGVSNYPVFCEILMQRPLRRPTLRIRNRLSSEDVAYMRTMVQGHFDEVMDCIRSLPRPMLLVFRNINTVRSITKNHGHPVDRFTLMARIATRHHASSQGRSSGFRVWLQCWWSYFVFECKLRLEYWHMQLSMLYLRCCLHLRGPNKDLEYLLDLASGDVSPV
ncbi:putative aarF domain-containing protein kinase 5 [Ixodes scapularis]